MASGLQVLRAECGEDLEARGVGFLLLLLLDPNNLLRKYFWRTLFREWAPSRLKQLQPQMSTRAAHRYCWMVNG